MELLYSRSGCAFFSDRYLVGAYSTDWRENWTLRHMPTEDFEDEDISYQFRFRDDWDA